MGGLAVLIFIGLYLVIAFKVVGKFKASRYKWLVIVAIVLLPTGDAMVGRVYLKYLCAREGGLKIYRVAEHVDGFMEAFGNIDDYWVKKGGYQFSESAPVNGLVTRYSRQSDGKIIKEEKVIPKSKYRVIFKSEVGDIYNSAVDQTEMVGTGEILASYKTFSFKGGWVERFLAMFSDAGITNVAFCENIPRSEIRHREVIFSSLKH